MAVSNQRSIQIVDCTLRDGEQAPGIAFTLDEKLELAKALSEAGVGTLDAGFPSVSEEEFDTLGQMIGLGLPAKVGATVRATTSDLDLAKDCGLRTVFMFHPASDIHIKYKFGISKPEVEERVARACAYSSKLGLQTFFVAEDSARQDCKWVAKLCDIAAENGAAGAILCDTVGILHPQGITDHVRGVSGAMKSALPLGIHCHNDYGMATANTLAAVSAGCVIVTATVNGIGERAGNAPLEEVVVALEELMQIDTGVNLAALPGLSSLVERMSGFFMSPCKPVVGRNVFTHESGVHVQGMLANPLCYESLAPERVGRTSRLILGKHSGTKLVQHLLSSRGISCTGPQLSEISKRVKKAKEKASKREFAKVAAELDEHYDHMVGLRDSEFWAIADEVLGRGSGRPAATHTVAQKILLSHALDSRNGFVHAKVDLAMGHDATTSLLIERFEQMGGSLWDSSKVLLVADHFSPPPTAERAAILQRFIDFAHSLPGVDLKLHEGICHQLLVEDRRVVPGSIVVGADSHTVTAGALGCLATGMGSTDMLRVMMQGSTWFRMPESLRVNFTGALRPDVMGRDVALKLLGELGEAGAVYKSIEFYDDAALSMDDRFSLCNAVVEAGAKCGIFAPDEITRKYLEQRGANDFEIVEADAGAEYERTIEVDLGKLEPLIACPDSPSNVATVGSVRGVKVNRAFVGSCASGRLTDLRAAAEVLQGERIHPGVQLVVIPASKTILLEAMSEGLIEIFVRAGAVVSNPSCGPCGGIANGLLAKDDVCVSSSTRNYRGRMGHPGAAVYLASARTVAVSAIRGELTT
jgi:3-isopropylmalate/(R)-2-methylmalate dehydratase large subunit